MIMKVHTAQGIRYLGIKEEAKRLGVGREHLWYVLTGRRVSKRITSQIKIKEVK